jgi:glycosyltransferase involved in cell wall biosynthesis
MKPDKIALPKHLEYPFIAPIAGEIHRPFWSVMIPTYNCAIYLEKTLESVLAQDPGPEEMQIEVVDDCSTKDDPETVVRQLGKKRVTFYRKVRNEGATANFNTCIQRSRGHLVHILHGDDYVLPEFYQRLSDAAIHYPDIALIASRSFFVDENCFILGVTDRLRDLERVGAVVDSFFYQTPIQTSGVVVRRSFYEKNGGFLPSLVHTADREMWARVVGWGGGLVMPEVLSCYRIFATNDSGRLARTAENLRDLERLNRIFAERYAGFDRMQALRRLCNLALSQVEHFRRTGDVEAVKANLHYWKTSAPTRLRLRKFAGRLASSALGNVF